SFVLPQAGKLSGSYNTVKVKGFNAYVGTGSTLKIISVLAHNDPDFVPNASISLGGTITQIEILNDNFVGVVAGNTLKIVDVSDINILKLKATLPLPASTSVLQFSQEENVLQVLTNNLGLLTIEMTVTSEETSPGEISRTVT
ncbi:hypothetical protein RZS08_35180, partial [Arthrospira platensis SPKY1]|nr:hypothetical protein [Arthrospira platensis SPKY1]